MVMCAMKRKEINEMKCDRRRAGDAALAQMVGVASLDDKRC